MRQPETKEEALEFLRSYREFPAETLTSVIVTDSVTTCRRGSTDRAKIWFQPIPDNVIDEYIETGDPFRHAGAFDHQHPLLAPFVKEIEGEPESITGLPKKLTLTLIKSVLREAALY